MGTREAYDFAARMRDMDNWFIGTRAKCSIEVLFQEEGRDLVNIYGAYLDSLKNDGMKLSFTTVHGDKDTTIHLDSVTKVTIIKETK